MTARPLILAALVLSLAVAAGGCASPTAGSSGPKSGTEPVVKTDAPASGEVRGQGTVLQLEGEEPQFCLGSVQESYPPQCSGPELVGWDWATADGDESVGGVTWGTYAVTGTWDGQRMTVSGQVMLALYDPMPIVDPLLDPAAAGESTEADLAIVQDELVDYSPATVQSSYTQNGYLFVQVVYDDGSFQKWADFQFGPDVVAVRSALQELG